MAQNPRAFDAPIPGMSLTAPPKGRPWRKPYQFSTVDEAVELYTDMMINPEFVRGMATAVERKMPLATIADLLITTNVMEGKHSLDLAVLVSPVVIEGMKALLDKEGISYTVGNERQKPTLSKTKLSDLVKSTVAEVKSESEMRGAFDAEKEMPTEEVGVVVEIMEEKPMQRGFIARRGEM